MEIFLWFIFWLAFVIPTYRVLKLDIGIVGFNDELLMLSLVWPLLLLSVINMRILLFILSPIIWVVSKLLRD